MTVAKIFHKLKIVRGVGYDQWQLIKYAGYHSSINFDVPAGRCMHFDPTTGTVKTGMPSAAKSLAVPYFTMADATDPEVQITTGGEPATDQLPYTHGFPVAKVGLLCALGHYEIETNQYSGAASAFPRNQGVTAANADTAEATGGVLVPGDAFDDPICGIVSDGVVNRNYENVLRLYTYFLPKSA